MVQKGRFKKKHKTRKLRIFKSKNKPEDNLWSCELQILKKKHCEKKHQAIIHTASLLKKKLKKITLSVIVFARKECCACLTKTRLKEVHFRLWGIMGFPTIRDSKSSCVRKKTQTRGLEEM